MEHESMIRRRVAKGNNEAQSRELLAELIRSHDGDNLAFALTYNDFATPRQAERFAGVQA